MMLPLTEKTMIWNVCFGRDRPTQFVSALSHVREKFDYRITCVESATVNLKDYILDNCIHLQAR